MRQLALNLADDRGLLMDLPSIEVGPIAHPIGEIRHVLRPAEKMVVREIIDIHISPRIREPLYLLSNGERVVVTGRRKIQMPEEADGVLHSAGNGTFRWLNHIIIDTFLADVRARGLAAIATEISAAWDGKVAFKAERLNQEGKVDAGSEGLRPPQLGALHAVGAHWSLHSKPATIVMPTGTGKTETMLAALAAFVRGPLLVVVPWDLLRQQTVRKLLTFGLLRQLCVLHPNAPNPIVGVITKRPQIQAELDILGSCNVIVATASSLTMGTAVPFAPDIVSRCSALIIDEAHHIAAPNWSQFKSAFSEKRVIQFTATPFRRDNQLVDGDVIFNYPLRFAQRDNYFKSIVFEPVYEIDQNLADEAIAAAAVATLRRDVNDNKNHLLMARCANINRAEAVLSLYQAAAADFNPILVHSELKDAEDRVKALRAGDSRIVVCVNMLGEGFDLPELKIAAVHDMHRSLAVLLQFIGRFTRTSADNIGDATVIANIADQEVSGALERLYCEDADWNNVLSELSSEAAREHAEMVTFLSESQRLGEEQNGEVCISHKLLRPALSTIVYRATDFRPRRFFEGLPKQTDVHGVWLHQRSETLYFVTCTEPKLRWTRSKEMKDRVWALFVIHYNREQRLLYLSSTDHSSTFAELAAAVGGDVAIISGDTIFRSLGNINRLIFQNVGVKKHGRRNLSFASYTGADVATALGLAERAGSVKNNLSGTGWENGERVAIGCSYKGRIWSREQANIPQLVKWCARVGGKLVDESINTAQIIANVLIPEEVDALPDKEVLGIEWPVELLSQSEERVVLTAKAWGELERPLFLVELAYRAIDRSNGSILFDLLGTEEQPLASFALIVGGTEGYRVDQVVGDEVFIKAGVRSCLLAEYLTDYSPTVRFVDLCELEGNMLIRPQNPQELTIPDDRFEIWDWRGIDITQESMWKNGSERRDSIQWHAAQQYINGGFSVVFDDDSAGEAADLVCLKEEADHIRLALVHCKFSGGQTSGERVKDVVEVSSQALRSAKWKWRFRDLIRHLLGREHRLSCAQRPSRFLVGQAADLNRFTKVSRFKEIRTEILIVQPGLSKKARTTEQNTVLASAFSYLKETIGIDLDIICNS